MTKPRGLGRGLGALFPTATASETQPAPAGASPLTHIAIERIKPNPDQPRRHFDEESLTALAQSIGAHGLLAPIIVRPNPAGEGFQIITGERRWRAARLAGLTSIAAIVRDAQAGEAIELAILENVQRADLNPIEEASGYRQLLEEHAYSQDALAQRLGKSRPAVANALRLLTLPDSVQALVRDGKLTAGHARAVASLSPARAKQLADEAVRLGLSVREVERRSMDASRNTKKPVSAPSAQPRHLSPDVADAENRLRFALATRVAVHPRAGAGGTIEIHYADDGEFTRILDRVAPQEY